MSGAPSSRSTRPNSRSTSSASVASQAKPRAPVSAQSAPSFSICRAASATRMPSRANSRASDALRPSPAPTIRAVLYLSNSMGAVLEWWSRYLGAQTGKATRRCQNQIEVGRVGHPSIFCAHHAERSGVIFLRLLGPDLVAQRDAEFFLSLPQRRLVGERPRPELFPDLPDHDRHQ